VGRDAAARLERERQRETVVREPIRPAAQVASITPLGGRREEIVVPRREEMGPARRTYEEVHPVGSSSGVAPALRAGATTAALQAAFAAAPPAARASTAPLLEAELMLEETFEVAEPEIEPRAAHETELRHHEARHTALPKPGLRTWSADDLDVPAFLRRQMD
jgi:hypothetical protein